jgi:hypothetical protein
MLRCLRRSRAIVAFATLPLVACTPELKVEENSNLLARETLAGVNCGDSWESVKKNHDPKLVVVEKTFNDKTSLFQLRRNLSDSLGASLDEGFFVKFSLGTDKRVEGMSVEVRGEGANQARAQAIEAALTMHFTAKTGRPPADRVSFNSFTSADPFPWIILHGNKATDTYVVHGAVACR